MSVKIDNQEASKKRWESTHPEGTTYPGHARIQVACLQRIAAATEAMSQYHVDLLKDRDRYQKWYYNKVEEVNRLERRIAALKGATTRAKKKLIVSPDTEILKVLATMLSALKDVVKQLPNNENLADFRLDFAEHAEDVATKLLKKHNVELPTNNS